MQKNVIFFVFWGSGSSFFELSLAHVYTFPRVNPGLKGGIVGIFDPLMHAAEL